MYHRDMLIQKGKVDSWPMPGPAFGMTVRFFEPVGPFIVRQVGNAWTVMDQRVANERGGMDRGIDFSSRSQVEDHIRRHNAR